jgi:hypothetical protein
MTRKGREQSRGLWSLSAPAPAIPEPYVRKTPLGAPTYETAVFVSSWRTRLTGVHSTHVIIRTVSGSALRLSALSADLLPHTRSKFPRDPPPRAGVMLLSTVDMPN